MLDSEELTSLRSMLVDWMPDSLQVRTYTREPDGRGGWREVPALSPPVPCRVAPVYAESENVEAGQLVATESWNVYCPVDTVVGETSTIVINGDRELAVRAVLSPRSNETRKHLVCLETTSGG